MTALPLDIFFLLCSAQPFQRWEIHWISISPFVEKEHPKDRRFDTGTFLEWNDVYDVSGSERLHEDRRDLQMPLEIFWGNIYLTHEGELVGFKNEKNVNCTCRPVLRQK